MAYHLTRLGWTDVVLIEQGQLSSGTTWHAAGLLGQLRATESGTRLVQYSAQLYSELERETGLATGFKRCGGVTVARTEDRMIQLRRTAATAESYDLECELIYPGAGPGAVSGPATDDLVGAIWFPGDGTANPVDVTPRWPAGPATGGARVFEHTRVVGIDRTRRPGDRGGDRQGLDRGRGGGHLRRAVGEGGCLQAGVNVPLHSAEHFYVVTEQIDGVRPDLPILRDPDGYTYFKEEVGGLVVGGFEPEAKPWVAPDRLPVPVRVPTPGRGLGALLCSHGERTGPHPRAPPHRHPEVLQRPGELHPDNQFILGEAPELESFFVGAGFNSVGIASAGGAGRALAEWIVQGEPTADLAAVDIRRFAPFNGNNQWLHDRVGEILGLHYAIPWPNRELVCARPFRRPPVVPPAGAGRRPVRVEDGMGAGQRLRPAGRASRASTTPGGSRTGCPGRWRSNTGTRRSVTVFDETSFGKLLVIGPEAEGCSNACAPPTWPCPSAGPSTPACSTTGRTFGACS